MNKRCIFSKNGPPAQGPYSHAVAEGNLLFVSGQGPVAHDGSGLRRVISKIEAALALTTQDHPPRRGSALTVLKSTLPVEYGRLGEFNEIYKSISR